MLNSGIRFDVEVISFLFGQLFKILQLHLKITATQIHYSGKTLTGIFVYQCLFQQSLKTVLTYADDIFKAKEQFCITTPSH